jgi:hypothetical protein
MEKEFPLRYHCAQYTPDGKKTDDADSAHATEESEAISAIAETAGAYMVEARSAEKTAQTGRYEIKSELIVCISKKKRHNANRAALQR